MSLQKQLSSSYHTDTFLRDRRLTAVDLPDIYTTLQDKILRTSHQDVNRIANQLCEKAHLAGSTSACRSKSQENDTAAHSSLESPYGGDANGRQNLPGINTTKKGIYKEEGEDKDLTKED